MRMTAGASEVATTTTARARPSRPRSRSMNSATSRPRSPIRATTDTSAAVPRAIIDISDDLPTPEPAKIPSRWPLPHGMRPSSTRTPSGSCSLTMARRNGWGGGPRTETSRPAIAGPSSMRATDPVEHPAQKLVTHANRQWPPRGRDRRAGPEPVRLPERQAHHPVVPERHDLGHHRTGRQVQEESVADGRGNPGYLDGHADHLGDLARATWTRRLQRRLGARRQAARSPSSPVTSGPSRICAHPLAGPPRVARRASSCRFRPLHLPVRSRDRVPPPFPATARAHRGSRRPPGSSGPEPATSPRRAREPGRWHRARD